jgi:hypothetical protein
MRYQNDDLISPTELSGTTGIAEKTLANWRVERKGPPYLKIGRRVYYNRASLARWLHKAESTSHANRIKK